MNSEHIEAAKQGMTVRVYRLQEKLRRLPLNPRSDALRNTRTHLSDNLIRLARLDKCVSKINLMAGTLD